MKQAAQLDKAQSQMRPGVITLAGLLGQDRRKLVEILDADDADVKRMGLTHAGIAARMRELREAGARGLGQPIRVAPHFDVQVESVRGKLPCPFEDGIVQKTNTTVRNLESGRTVTYTDLNLHMIELHGFYQGRGSGFRLDPRDLVAVLEVAPEKESSPR
jgi:hypothetical protein